MILITWRSGQRAPVTRKGTHVPGTPRRWRIEIWFKAADGKKQNVTVTTPQPMTLLQLNSIIDDARFAFEMEHGDAVDAGWTATARC